MKLKVKCSGDKMLPKSTIKKEGLGSLARKAITDVEKSEQHHSVESNLAHRLVMLQVHLPRRSVYKLHGYNLAVSSKEFVWMNYL